MGKAEKTNVMRLLDSRKIPYRFHNYGDTDAVSGTDVASVLGEPPEKVFKTLVAVGKSRQAYVFVVPVEKELDLKKAAAAAGEKSMEMLKAKELLPLTGYVHGGCSPIAMKKPLPTFLDSSAQFQDTICLSAGRIGFQIEIGPSDLTGLTGASYRDLT